MLLTALRRSFILFAASASTASAEIIGPNADSIPKDSWVGIYFNHFDLAAKAARLPLLRETPLRSGEREVRIWTQVEIGAPKHLYRFTERNGRVSGDQIEYWGVHSSTGERPAEPWDDLMMDSQRGRCAGSATSSEMATCRVRFKREPGWNAVLRDAGAHGLWTLPDPSALPPDHVVVLDGWTMVVELRDGERYRTYRYNNPESHTKWPSAAQAGEIARTLSGIDSLALPPDVWKTYRGITTGRYQSAFRSCDGAEWEFHDDLRSLVEAPLTQRPGEARSARGQHRARQHALRGGAARRAHAGVAGAQVGVEVSAGASGDRAARGAPCPTVSAMLFTLSYARLPPVMPVPAPSAAR